MVIGLGAFTRLTNAGLGCPDWPGCYGHFTVPSSTQAIKNAETQYPQTKIVQAKAWAEMVHRYAAGTLASLVLVVAILCTVTAVNNGFRFLILGLLLLALVVYQALLGMWTVTLKLLPLIVSQHLLGGLTLFALLWLVYLSAKHIHSIRAVTTSRLIKTSAVIGLILVFIQIALGAWTSTNYASLSCPDFPFCNLHTPWHLEFSAAFNLFSPIGIDYEGGVLNGAARMTIQTVHRFGALIVGLYLVMLTVGIYRNASAQPPLKRISLIILFLLLLQICLGISNVIFKLPLHVAVAHNLCAALLLIALVTLNFYAFQRSSREVLNP